MRDRSNAAGSACTGSPSRESCLDEAGQELRVAGQRRELFEPAPPPCALATRSTASPAAFESRCGPPAGRGRRIEPGEIDLDRRFEDKGQEALDQRPNIVGRGVPARATAGRTWSRTTRTVR